MLLYILITVLMLGILILVHEFGHFLAARRFGVKVEEFALGMGPAIYQKQTEKTLYSIRIFPIGGYCKMQGEQEEDNIEEVYLLDGSVAEIKNKEVKEINPEENFINKKPYQKIIILAAGVTMNFLLGLLIIFIALLISGRPPVTAFINSFNVFFQLIGLVFYSLKLLFTGGASINDLTGPVGIVQVVQTYYSYGVTFMLLFMAMLSVNLGILNLLPIPALDGGQILIVGIEKIKNGSLNERFKSILFTLSYVLLLGLGVYVAIQDFIRFTN